MTADLTPDLLRHELGHALAFGVLGHCAWIAPRGDDGGAITLPFRLADRRTPVPVRRWSRAVTVAGIAFTAITDSRMPATLTRADRLAGGWGLELPRGPAATCAWDYARLRADLAAGRVTVARLDRDMRAAMVLAALLADAGVIDRLVTRLQEGRPPVFFAYHVRQRLRPFVRETAAIMRGYYED